MSLIFGINLSDRVYISGDTRISKEIIGSNDVEILNDYAQKVLPIDSDLVVAAAGNLRLAKYLLDSLSDERGAFNDIDELRGSIKDWAIKNVSSYLEKYGSNHRNKSANACLIIAGKKRGPKKITRSLARAHFQKFLERKKSTNLSMKPIVFEASNESPNVSEVIELQTNEILLFGLTVVTQPGNSSVNVEDASWGEFIAFGPKRFSRNQIPEDTLSRFEFEQGAGDIQRDQLVSTALINHISRDYDLKSVGGEVISLELSDKGIRISEGGAFSYNTAQPDEGLQIMSSIRILDGKLFHETSDKILIPIIPFTEISESSGESMI